ncbi:MAG: VWA domain-containing protein [Thermoanaerobaculia bacterium]
MPARGLAVGLRLLAVASVCVAALAAKPRAAEKFEARIDVVEVQIPVQVIGRDGLPVRGLARDQFRVYDEGQEQEVTRFEVVDLEQSAAASPTAVTSDSVARRHVLLLFDLSFSNPLAIGRARRAAREFVLHGLHPSDLAAVAVYSVEYGPRLLLTFTPDRAQVARALDSLTFDRHFQEVPSADPLRFVLDFPPTSGSELASGVGGETRDLRSEIQEVVTENAQLIANTVEREQKQYDRSRIDTWTRDLGRLGRQLAAIQGRKQVVLFSEGFDSRLLLGRSDLGGADQAQESLNAELGEIWQVDSDSRFGNTGLQGAAGRMLEELRRADCVVQAIDIGGLRAGGDVRAGAKGLGEEALFYVANETGGELFKDTNNLDQQLAAAMKRTSVTYLLAFQAKNLKLDGAFRSLRVELSGVRGARLSHRSGYYAPRPFDELAPLERNLLAADVIAAAEPRQDLDLSVLAAPFRSGPGGAYVPVVVETSGKSLLASAPNGKVTVEIYAYATNGAGEMVDFFARTLQLDASAAGKALADGGLKYYGHLELEPGDYLVRVLVREGASGRMALAAVPISVPSVSAATPRLLPPFLFDSPGRWLMVRERVDSNGSIVYPFTLEGEPYVPAAGGAVERGGPLRFCLVGYDLPDSPLDVRAELVGVDGRQAAIGALDARRTATGIAGLDKWSATLATDQVPPGSYRLKVEVVPAGGGAPWVSETAVRIAG